MDSVSVISYNYNRNDLLKYHLCSLINQTDKDFEIVIVSEIINTEIKNIVNEFKDKLNIKLIIMDSTKGKYKPVRPAWEAGLNLAVKYSSNDIIVITAPEMLHHCKNIENAKKHYHINKMIIGTCVTFPDSNYTNHFLDTIKDRNYYFDKDWHDPVFRNQGLFYYQHPELHKRYLHFLGVISRERYMKVGGMPEDFSEGNWYEDDCFVEYLKANDTEYDWTNDLYIAHMWHIPMHVYIGDKFMENRNRNFKLYETYKDRLSKGERVLNSGICGDDILIVEVI